LWRIVDDRGGSDAFPDEVDRSLSAFMWYFRHSTRVRVLSRRRGPDIRPIPEGVRAADAYEHLHWNDSLR
jgi:hypothetical protein